MRKLLLSLLALLFLASCSEGNGEKIAVEDFEFSDWNDFLQIEEAVPLEENEECVLSVDAVLPCACQAWQVVVAYQAGPQAA